MVIRKFAPHAAHILWENGNEYMNYNGIAELIRLREPDLVAGSRTLEKSVLRDIRQSGFFQQRAKQRPHWRLNEKGIEHWFGVEKQSTPNKRIHLTEQIASAAKPGTRISLSETNGLAKPATRKSNDAIRREHVRVQLKAVDLADPPKRMQATINRICRDTARARRVKELHQY